MKQLLRHLHSGQSGEVFKVFVLVARCTCILYGIAILTMGMFFIALGGMNFWLNFIVGACAASVGMIPVTKPAQEDIRSIIIIILSTIGLLFQAMDVAHYYRYLKIPGSHYPWQIQLPIIMALIFMIIHSGISRNVTT